MSPHASSIESRVSSTPIFGVPFADVTIAGKQVGAVAKMSSCKDAAVFSARSAFVMRACRVKRVRDPDAADAA